MSNPQAIGKAIGILFNVAGNGEEQMLQDLLLRAGLKWQCSTLECSADLHAYTVQCCPECGMVRPEQAKRIAALFGP